ncbi:hypothetical protein D9758_006646 [Tetrapyrgos nigripes]|uniref:Uncharacterized protein n=1 Tax=Tetrapyrgos nigripes TaxID=182062 RepID=A0A8H5GJ95_9AGAR|nr:hypothetical protein D9758_006646 [Tetrapyrgos nigripes]
MRATIRLYEDPMGFSTADIWTKSDTPKTRAYRVMGVLLFAALSTYAALRFTTLGQAFSESSLFHH